MKKHKHDCHDCHYVAYSLDKLQEHIDKNHQLKFKCNQCTEHLSSESELQNHQKNVHTFLCSDCNIKFSSQDQKEHYQECGECNSIFKTLSEVKEHELKEHFYPCVRFVNW